MKIFSQKNQAVTRLKVVQPLVAQTARFRRDTVSLRFQGRVATLSADTYLHSKISHALPVGQTLGAYLEGFFARYEKLYATMQEAAFLSLCLGGDYREPEQEFTYLEKERHARRAFTLYLARHVMEPNMITDLKRVLEIVLQNQSFSSKSISHLELREIKKLLGILQVIPVEWDLTGPTSNLMRDYSHFQPMLGGTIYSMSEINRRLAQTHDSTEAQRLWQALGVHGEAEAKAPGFQGKNMVEALAILVRKRNASARDVLGKNYFAVKLHEAGMTEKGLDAWLNQMDVATREPYRQYLQEARREARKRFNLSGAEPLMPWHEYDGNRQRLYNFDLTPYLAGKDPIELLRWVAEQTGNRELIEQILRDTFYMRNGERRNALYFDPVVDAGKIQHWIAFASSPGTVRLLGSLDVDHNRLDETAIRYLFHEGMGHGIHFLLSGKNPILFRRAHSTISEGVATLQEHLLADPAFLRHVGVPEAQIPLAVKTYKMRELEQIRWLLTVVRFEWEMYKNPDQNFNDLWWETAKRYLGTDRPPPGQDSPIFINRIPHLFISPAYCQNFLLAHMMAAQTLDAMERKGIGLIGADAAKFLNPYYELGDSVEWQDLIKDMTGEALKGNALKQRFKDLPFTE